MNDYLTKLEVPDGSTEPKSDRRDRQGEIDRIDREEYSSKFGVVQIKSGEYSISYDPDSDTVIGEGPLPLNGMEE